MYLFFYTSMGIYQVLAALVRLVIVERLTSSYAIHIKRYLLIVVLYFSVLYAALAGVTGGALNFYLFLLPWIISIWHLMMLRKHSLLKRNVTMYDMGKGQATSRMALTHSHHPMKKKICLQGLRVVKTQCPDEDQSVLKLLPLSQTYHHANRIRHNNENISISTVQVGNPWHVIIEDSIS